MTGGSYWLLEEGGTALRGFSLGKLKGRKSSLLIRVWLLETLNLSFLGLVHNLSQELEDE